jgi:hypothetical protein
MKLIRCRRTLLNSCGVRNRELRLDSTLADGQNTVMCLVRIWAGARYPEIVLYLLLSVLKTTADDPVIKGHLALSTVLAITCNKNMNLER